MDRSVGLDIGGCHSCCERGLWGLSAGGSEVFTPQAIRHIGQIRHTAEAVYRAAPDLPAEQLMDIVFGGTKHPGIKPLKGGPAVCINETCVTTGDVAWRTLVCLGAIAEAGCPLLPI